MTIVRGWRTWLRPGMHVKRWAALFLLGIILTGLSVAMALVYSYRHVAFPEPVSGLIQAITLQFIPRELRFALVFVAGIVSMVYGFYRLSNALIQPVLAHAKADKRLVQILAEHRFGLSRPEINVVAVGGGTGLATLLRGLKQHDLSITAIVTVADDGGSTGKIRSAYDPLRETSATVSSPWPMTSRSSRASSSTGSVSPIRSSTAIPSAICSSPRSAR